MPNKEINEYGICQAYTFIDSRCQGNPAGVCLLPEEISQNHFKQIAIHINTPETAFVYRKNNIYQLRWFSRTGTEMDLCGHATLATAHILWDKKYHSPNEAICFSTKSGQLSASQKGGIMFLSFPLEILVEVRSCEYNFAGILDLPLVYIARTKFDYLIVTDNENTVKRFSPNYDKLRKIKTRGIIITAKSDSSKYDYINRFFAPLMGVNEDPVTGSAHCGLGIYWSSVLTKKKLVGYQASKEGGVVKVEILNDQILIGGKAREAAVSDELKNTIIKILSSNNT